MSVHYFSAEDAKGPRSDGSDSNVNYASLADVDVGKKGGYGSDGETSNERENCVCDFETASSELRAENEDGDACNDALSFTELARSGKLPKDEDVFELEVTCNCLNNRLPFLRAFKIGFQ